MRRCGSTTHALGESYLLVQVPTITLAGSAGIWLFYVQHQFQNVYFWERGERWS